MSFSVSTGARTSHLFTVEWYNTNIVLTPLNPCLDVNSVTVEASGNQILVKQSIYHNTVKVSALLRAQGIISLYNEVFDDVYGVLLRWQLLALQRCIASCNLTLGQSLFIFNLSSTKNFEVFFPIYKYPFAFKAKDRAIKIYLVLANSN